MEGERRSHSEDWPRVGQDFRGSIRRRLALSAIASEAKGGRGRKGAMDYSAKAQQQKTKQNKKASDTHADATAFRHTKKNTKKKQKHQQISDQLDVCVCVWVRVRRRHMHEKVNPFACQGSHSLSPWVAARKPGRKPAKKRLSGAV